LIFQY